MKFCSTALIAVLAYIALSHAIPTNWFSWPTASLAMTLPPSPRFFLFSDLDHPLSCHQLGIIVRDMYQMVSALAKMMEIPDARTTVGVRLTLGDRAFWICESR